MKIKFCGLRQTSELDLACELQVDAIGLVFVKKSVRHVTIEQAKVLSQHLRNSSHAIKPRLVALFVNPDVDFVRQVTKDVAPDVLQFHGQEAAEFCRQFAVTYWKAIAMFDAQPWQKRLEHYHDAEYCLLDAYRTGAMGGSGEAFEWFRFPENVRQRLILAGGLNADNIQAAIEQTQTHYLDVSSGIESMRGVKSPLLMKQLIQLVNPS